MTQAGWGVLLADHREALVDRWVARVRVAHAGRTASGEIGHDITEILDTLISGARAGGTDLGDGAFDELRSLLEDMSRSRARQGLTPTETAVSVFALRDAALALFQEGVAWSPEDLAELSRVVDDMGLFTFETYARTREAVITEQATQLLELSTPVVKLWDGVVAVPLVGTLDSARTQTVTEKLLQTLVDTGSDHAIIDITGVPAVDTQVAQHLLKTIMAARLMGAECIISGIRPQIAQTIVALGIDFGEITTKASLADALVLALRRSGTDVVRSAQRARP